MYYMHGIVLMVRNMGTGPNLCCDVAEVIQYHSQLHSNLTNLP